MTRFNSSIQDPICQLTCHFFPQLKYTMGFEINPWKICRFKSGTLISVFNVYILTQIAIMYSTPILPVILLKMKQPRSFLCRNISMSVYLWWIHWCSEISVNLISIAAKCSILYVLNAEGQLHVMSKLQIFIFLYEWSIAKSKEMIF